MRENGVVVANYLWISDGTLMSNLLSVNVSGIIGVVMYNRFTHYGELADGSQEWGMNFTHCSN